jgi:putative ABC transport system permease protein
MTRGATPAAPAGTTHWPNRAVEADTRRPLKDAEKTLIMNQVMLWTIAACVLGSVLYLSAVERARDVAVMKATGTRTAAIAGGLAFQAVVLAGLSSLLAMVIGTLLAPVYPIPVELPVSGYVTLPVVAVLVGIFGSLAGLSRLVKVEPALAFGGA